MIREEINILVSVVIPIYNVEVYLKQCVDSVLNQTYKKLEVVLVDDGSTDNCPMICDQYADQDHRIIVIHKENGGLSDARNCGIARAKGDYVLFLDSDDFWDDNDAVMRLVERVTQTKADVLNYSYKKYYSESKTISYFTDIMPMPEEYHDLSMQLQYLSANNLYIASACNKMIRLRLFTEDLLFKKGVYSEDIEWCARLLLKAKCMDFLCENFYCYRQRESSITHTVSQQKCKNLCDNIIKVIELCKLNMQNKGLLSYAAYQYGTFIITQAHSDEFPRNEIERLEKYRWILQYHGNNHKVTFLFLLGNIIKLKGMCHVARMIYGHDER